MAHPKDGPDRWVKASAALLNALRNHLEAIALDGSVEEWSIEQRQLVFPTTSGNLLRYPYFLERVWTPLLSRVKLPYRPYHSTRHSYATWLLSADRLEQENCLRKMTRQALRPFRYLRIPAQDVTGYISCASSSSAASSLAAAPAA